MDDVIVDVADPSDFLGDGIFAFPGTVSTRTRDVRVPRFTQVARRVADDLVAIGDGLALAAAALVNAQAPAVAIAFAVTCFLALRLQGSHRRRLRLSVAEQAPWLAYQLGLATLLLLPLAALAPEPQALVLQVPLSVGAVLIGRAATYGALRIGRQRGLLAEPAVVIGGGEHAHRIADMLASHVDHGLHPVLVNDALADNLPVGVNHVILSPDVVVDDEIESRLRRFKCENRHVYVLPRLGALLPTAAHLDLDYVGTLTLHELPPFGPTTPAWRAKRVFDIVGSLLLLAVFSPVLLVAAIGVRVTSPGPILFRQERVGRDGTRFRMLKFRTFPVDHIDDKFSLANGECPLRWGRFLRRTSIDEMPQLLNVLRGEMSLVGPRPERPHFVAPLTETVPGYSDRHRVPGGMTGLAQVNGLWGDTSVHERARFDNRYIDGWTLWRDVVIILRTVPAILRKVRD